MSEKTSSCGGSDSFYSTSQADRAKHVLITSDNNIHTYGKPSILGHSHEKISLEIKMGLYYFNHGVHVFYV